MKWYALLAILALATGMAQAQELFYDGSFEVQGTTGLVVAGGVDGKSWEHDLMQAAGVSDYGWYTPAITIGVSMADYGTPETPNYKLENTALVTSNIACLVADGLSLAEGSMMTYSLTINGTVGAGIVLYMLPRYQADIDGSGPVTYNGGAIWSDQATLGSNYSLPAGVYDNQTITLTYTLPAVAPSAYNGQDPCPAPFEAMMVRVMMYGSADNNFTLDNFSLTIPEPASLCLLGLGSLTLIRRRR